MDTAPDKLLEELRTVVAQAEDLLKDAAGEGGAKLEEQVRSHPWAAVGIAAGIGLVLGLLLARK